jgi:plastocyanin
MAWMFAASALGADQTITFPTGTASSPYSPANVSIDRGNTVTFNGAFDNHPLVWDAGNFATQATGMSMGYTFAQPGVYRFHCQVHPTSMVGSVTVVGDQLATPDFTFSPAQPRAGQAVTFSATAFTDPDGSIARYEWDLDGDGAFESTGQAVTHTYGAGGNYSAALRYVDDRNETSSATTRAFTVAPGAGGEPGRPGSGGAPIQPGAPGSKGSPGSGTQGAGSNGSGTKAPRLRIGARARAFHDGKARVSVTFARAATLMATLRRSGRTLATGAATTRRAGTKSITLKLTRAGMRAMRRAHGPVRATLAVVARARKGSTTATASRTLSVTG